jgi:Fe-S-cluster containining protein
MAFAPEACAISSIRPSTCAGTPDSIDVGGVPEPGRPVLAHQVVVAADAAGGDDDGLRAQLHLADLDP